MTTAGIDVEVTVTAGGRDVLVVVDHEVTGGRVDVEMLVVVAVLQ